jgi:hypothetical protein
LIQSELNEAEGKSRRTGKPARRFKIQKKQRTQYLGAVLLLLGTGEEYLGAGLEFVLFRPRSQFLKLGRF